MKRIIIIYLLLFSHTLINGMSNITVDPRFELISILMRISKAEEYMPDHYSLYDKEVDSYFSDFQNHPIVELINKLRDNFEFGYDVPMAFASCLVIQQDTILVDEVAYNSLQLPIDNITLKKFLISLNNFYTSSNFSEFYHSHMDMYCRICDTVSLYVNDIDIFWMNSFTGYDIRDFNIIVSTINSKNNYAYMTSEDKGIVLGCQLTIENNPIFSYLQKQLIVHELLHLYLSPIIDIAWQDISVVSNNLYNQCKSKFVSPKVMIEEWLVRLITIYYFDAKPIPYLSKESMIAYETESSIIWMSRSYDYFAHYSNNRKQYTTLYDFIPCIYNFLQFTYENWDNIYMEYLNRNPYITEIFYKETSSGYAIEIVFSEPMLMEAYGVISVNNHITFPKLTNEAFWASDTRFVIPISSENAPAEYGIRLLNNVFVSQRHYHMLEDYIYIFKI